MAITKIFKSTNFPYIRITLQIKNRIETVEALLDTGFDGDIALPKGMLTNGDIPDSYSPWELADGSIILAPLYIGKGRINQIGSFVLTIITVGDEPLIGRGITDRFKVILDHGNKIIVER